MEDSNLVRSVGRRRRRSVLQKKRRLRRKRLRSRRVHLLRSRCRNSILGCRNRWKKGRSRRNLSRRGHFLLSILAPANPRTRCRRCQCLVRKCQQSRRKRALGLYSVPLVDWVRLAVLSKSQTLIQRNLYLELLPRQTARPKNRNLLPLNLLQLLRHQFLDLVSRQDSLLESLRHQRKLQRKNLLRLQLYHPPCLKIWMTVWTSPTLHPPHVTP